MEREADAMGARARESAEPHVWRVSIIKKKLEYLGRVEAADKASAALAAAAAFGLKDHQVNRLVIDESPF